MTDMSHQCVIVGIAGASASGKSLIASTLYRELREQVGDEHIGVIPEDSYYKDQSHLSMEERVKTNYDHPSSMDHSLLFQHLQMLKSGQPIELPVYSYVEHTRTPNTIHVEPKKVIILEGILLLTDARLRNELNFSIFVDTPLDICLMRRIKRDVNERGRSMDSVMAQYQKTVRPMFLQFIEPSSWFSAGARGCRRRAFSRWGLQPQLWRGRPPRADSSDAGRRGAGPAGEPFPGTAAGSGDLLCANWPAV